MVEKLHDLKGQYDYLNSVLDIDKINTGNCEIFKMPQLPKKKQVSPILPQQMKLSLNSSFLWTVEELRA